MANCKKIHEIESELNINVLGFFPEQANLHMESRHLGLILPEELAHIREELQEAAEIFCRNVSPEAVAEIAGGAGEITVGQRMGIAGGGSERPVIAVARDEAFCFYYAENLELLREYGARIEYFIPENPFASAI